MNIIVKSSTMDIVERIGSFNILKETKSINRSKRMPSVEKLLGNSIHKCSPSLSSFISKINSTVDYEMLPNIIRFDYDELKDSSLEIKDVVDVLRISYNLAALRAANKPKHFILSGFSHGGLDSKFVDSLKINNFAGGMLSLRKSESLEEFKYFSMQWDKDNSLWHKSLVTNTNTVNTRAQGLVHSIELSFRQQQICNLILKRGLTNKQMAKEFGISEQAVKNHVSLILKKYGLRSRTQLALSLSDKW